MNDIQINTNQLEKLDEVMGVAEVIFQPNQEEKERYHRKEDWLTKANNGLLVSASIDNKIVGFALCYRKENILHIWNVGVLPEHRKSGIWQKMYEQVETFARGDGYSGLSLNTYKEKFPGMFNFCTTHGFEEYKTEFDELSGSTKSMFVKMFSRQFSYGD